MFHRLHLEIYLDDYQINVTLFQSTQLPNMVFEWTDVLTSCCTDSSSPCLDSQLIYINTALTFKHTLLHLFVISTGTPHAKNILLSLRHIRKAFQASCEHSSCDMLNSPNPDHNRAASLATGQAALTTQQAGTNRPTVSTAVKYSKHCCRWISSLDQIKEWVERSPLLELRHE